MNKSGPGKLRVAEVASYKGPQSTSGRRFWRKSRRHVTLFLSSSFLDKRSSDENGGIRRRVNKSLSEPFQEERLGLGLYPGEEGYTCKNSKGDVRPIFWVWNLGKSFLWAGGGCRKLSIFWGQVKQWPQFWSIFHPRLQCNFQKLLRFHREENLQHGHTSTRCDGKICWQINCQNIILGILL